MPILTPAKKMERTALKALKQLKALDIVSLNVRHLTTITETMVIATGTSNRHVNALANLVTELLRIEKYKPVSVEGQTSGEWVLIDMGDIMIHILQQRTRDFYQLEKLWDIPKMPKEKKGKVS